MIYKNKTTKLIVLSSVLVITMGLAATLVVACSNTSNPAITTATTFKYTDAGTTQTVTVSNEARLSLNPGISVKTQDNTDSKLYTQTPAIVDFSKASVEDQRAFGYFNILTNFVTWLQGYAINVQNFLSAAPIELSTYNEKFAKNDNFVSPPVEHVYNDNIENLAAALSTTINEGRAVARLGLKEVSFTSNFLELINDTSFLIPYNEGAVVDTPPPEFNAFSLVENINLKYNWWTTGGNNVSWLADNWNVDGQNLVAWNQYLEKGFDAPEPYYELGLTNISFNWRTKYSENAETKKHFPSGFVEFAEPDHAFTMIGLENGTKTKELIDFVIEADKRRVGDYVNQTFGDYVIEHKDTMIPAFLITLKR